MVNKYFIFIFVQLTELLKDKPKRVRHDLQLGEASMGVYKLKTERDYSVPEDERVSSETVANLISTIKSKVIIKILTGKNNAFGKIRSKFCKYTKIQKH